MDARTWRDVNEKLYTADVYRAHAACVTHENVDELFLNAVDDLRSMYETLVDDMETVYRPRLIAAGLIDDSTLTSEYELFHQKLASAIYSNCKARGI